MKRSFPDGLHLNRCNHGLTFIIAAATIATLSLGGWNAARGVSHTWQTTATQQVTIEIPDMAGEAHETAKMLIEALNSDPGIVSAETLSDQQIRALLKPWLGSMKDDLDDLPIVIALTRRNGQLRTDIPAILDIIAPSAVIEENEAWTSRLTRLGRSLQVCAWLAIALAGATIAGATTFSVRMTLLTRKHALRILHGFGAGDSMLVRRIAWHNARLGLTGAAIGTALGSAILTILHCLMIPFVAPESTARSIWPQKNEDWLAAWTTLPEAFFPALMGIPLLMSAISFLIAQVSVRLWLRRLS